MFKFLRYILASKQSSARGVGYVTPPVYEIDPPKEYLQFFTTLSQYFPANSILFLEDGAFPSKFEAFLKSNSIACDIVLAPGTIWPKPRAYHLPIQPKLMLELAQWGAKLAEPELCSHLRIHDGKKLLLHWYDFPHDPMYVSAELGEQAVASLARQLGTAYRLEKNGL